MKHFAVLITLTSHKGKAPERTHTLAGFISAPSADAAVEAAIPIAYANLQLAGGTPDDFYTNDVQVLDGFFSNIQHTTPDEDL